jgi:hypothetical protein
MNGYKGGGLVEAMHFLRNIALIYPIFSLKKLLFSNIFFVKSGLTLCNISFLFRLRFVKDVLQRLEAQINKQ